MLKNFRTKENELSNRLCLPIHNIGDKEVPTKEDLRELEANIEFLQNEMVIEQTKPVTVYVSRC